MSCRRRRGTSRNCAAACSTRPRGYGFELVMPPLLEHIESLLSGTGHALDLQTFKLVDQLSGRTLGLRADTTPQVARIDAHLLNRSGVARLCYCGPVLHTRPAGAACDARAAAVRRRDLRPRRPRGRPRDPRPGARLPARRRRSRTSSLDLADARIVRARARRRRRSTRDRLDAVYAALAAKDAADAARARRAAFPRRRAQRPARRCSACTATTTCSTQPRARCPARRRSRAALDDLRTAGRARARRRIREVRVGFDLADSSGYAYYSGARFAVYARGASDAIARGGRYDEVGAVFGRNRPGGRLQPRRQGRWRCCRGRRRRARAIRAPWGEDAALRAAVRDLRERGETVVVRPARARARGRRSSTATASWSQSGGRWVVAQR